MASSALKIAPFAAALGLSLAVLGTGCQKRAQLRAETQEVNETLREHAATLKKLDVDLADLGNLGRYRDPQKHHFDELNLKIQTLKDETAHLVEQRDDEKKVVERLEKELDAYRSKYGK